jgi:hypothetical protein
MDQKPDVIRQEIEETRSSLAEKLEALEGQVKGTISTVSQSVEDTVTKVKTTVNDTVETVKRTFDLPYQVDQHPWTMTGCSLLAGMAVGYAVARSGDRATGGRRGYTPRGDFGRVPAAPAPVRETPSPIPFEPAYQAAASAGAAGYRREEEEPGVLSRLLAPFASEFDKIKATAVAALMGMLRDSLVRSAPPALAERVREIMDDLTRKAGGQPISEPVLPTGATPETRAGRTGPIPDL